MNVVEKGESRELKKIEDVLTPKRFILEALRKADMVKYNSDKGDWCLLHPGELHDVETCPLQCLLSFMLSKTSMSSVLYAFKDFNVFCLLHFQRLQCLLFYDFQRLQRLLLYIFIGLNVLYLYLS